MIDTTSIINAKRCMHEAQGIVKGSQKLSGFEAYILLKSVRQSLIYFNYMHGSQSVWITEIVKKVSKGIGWLRDNCLPQMFQNIPEMPCPLAAFLGV